MKNTWKMLAGVTAALIGFSSAVQAIPITGSINFQDGTMTFNNTAITSFGNPSFVTGGALAPTGAYASVPSGGSSPAVTFAVGGFVYSPGLSGLVNPLWTFTYAGSIYSFALSAVTFSSYNGGTQPTLAISGIGALSISGGTYTTTPGTFSISATGSGPTTFGFVAGNKAVPDGGMTVMMLGMALSGVALLRKKLTA
jgi:hypothetical protein